MTRRLFSAHAAIVLALLLAAPVAARSKRDASIDSEGKLFYIHEGTYGELVPGEGLADPANPALALEVVYPDQTSERYLVPDTESEDVEDSASILYEDQSGTLFVLWQTKMNVIHSRLNLIGFRAGEWTAPIEISGKPFGWKSAPQLAVTRDTFRTEEPNGSQRTWQRTVVHLLWWETAGTGDLLVFYSPVVLLDGAYSGWNPVYRLDELTPGEGTAPPPSLNLSLAQHPRIESGRNSQTAVIGFVDPATGELNTYTVEVLAGEFGFLADKVRHQISEIGRDLLPEQPVALAEKARHQISEIGNRLGLHVSVTGYLAEQAYREILSAPTGEDAGVIAERVRHQISEIGARLTDRGLGRMTPKSAMHILELPNDGAADSVPTHLLSVTQASVWPAPSTGTEGVTLHLSRSGREVLVAWEQGGVVYYRESRGQGWSEPHRLVLSEELDVEGARRILEQRADERASE